MGLFVFVPSCMLMSIGHLILVKKKKTNQFLARDM